MVRSVGSSHSIFITITFFGGVDAYVKVSELCGTEWQGSGTHLRPIKDENAYVFKGTAPASIQGEGE